MRKIIGQERKVSKHRMGFIKSGLLVVAITCLFISAENAMGSTDISLCWQTNPEAEDVLGYRLYLSGESRFDSNGNLKSNFDYSHYIDLTDATRCDINGNNCEGLGPDEMLCENLYGEEPKCTLLNLQVTTYFALTAFNAVSESDFTHELVYTKPNPGTGGPNAGNTNTIAAVNSIIKSLLLASN